MTKFVTKCNFCGGAVVPVAVNKGGKAPKVSHMKCMMAAMTASRAHVTGVNKGK